jgi:hypothetical protein
MDRMDVATTASEVKERRIAPRFYLLARADVTIPGRGDTYWASLANISRTGLALITRQHLQPNSKVMIRLRFHMDDGREVTEALAAKVVWHCGDHAGVQFEAPLIPGSPASQRTPHLVAHLVRRESGG